jgi:cytochrome c oxidase subunit 3
MSGAHAAQHPKLQHHFDNLEQQFEASALGMWLFLVTEILFFGGLFLAYLVYRLTYPQAFAESSQELDVVLGGINTGVLIGSSLTMAMAVWSAQLGRRSGQMLFLALTIGLGLVFLGIKAVEYSHKFEHHLVPGPNFLFESARDPQHAQLFFSLYFVMTGLHALHMVVGIGLMAVLSVMAFKGRFTRAYTRRSRSAPLLAL